MGVVVSSTPNFDWDSRIHISGTIMKTKIEVKYLKATFPTSLEQARYTGLVTEPKIGSIDYSFPALGTI